MDIKVNDQEWNDISKDEQQRITDIITGYFKDARIVPDAATLKTAVAPQGNPFCKIGCDAAEAAAATACTNLTNPIAVAACIAAAHAAGDECRNRC